MWLAITKISKPPPARRKLRWSTPAQNQRPHSRHATATTIGDAAEANAIRVAHCEHAAVYAPKGALGHSIGAVGALESMLTVLTLRDGVIPPTLNYETPDPEIDLDVVAGEPRYGDYRYAINNSFGFGGHNVALAFGRY